MRDRMRGNIVFVLMLAIGCMSSRDPVPNLPATVLTIPAVVAVRAEDQSTAEDVASDLMALQIFGAVRIDDQSTTDYDLLAIHRPRSVPLDDGLCDDSPGATFLLSVLLLTIPPSCMLEGGYELDLLANGSMEMIRVTPDYKATTWLGIHTLLLNFSPNWHYGPADEEVRRRSILSAISAERSAILRSLQLEYGSIPDGIPD